MATDWAKIAKHCKCVESKLFSAFEKRKSHLLDICREVYPVAIAGLTRGTEELADGYVYDEEHRLLTTAPLEALRRGAAGFHGNLTSPATPWFRFRFAKGSQDGVEPTHEDRKVLSDLTEATRSAFARSNAYPSIHKLYEHCLAVGFGCMIVSKDADRIARCETLRLGTYALGIGDDGMVDTCVHRFAWTAAQIVKQFGRDSVPQYILDGKDDPIKRYEVVNLIEPNAVGDFRKDDEISEEIGLSDEAVYRSIFWLKGGSGETKNAGVLRVVGFSCSPIIAPRMDYELGDIYGRGRGDDALDLCRGCQSFKYDELNIVGKQSDPAFLADAELKDEGLKKYRGAVNYARFGEGRQQMVAPIDPNPPSPNDAREERADAQNEIARLFYNDAFSVIDNLRATKSGQVTATEVENQVREAMQRLAPVATLFDKELLDPLCSIMAKYAIAARRTPLSEQEAKVLSEVEVEYVSSIHLAQKQSSISAIQQILQMTLTLAGAKPEILYRIDLDKTFTTLADLVGFPENCLVGDKEYAAAIDAMKKAAAQQAQMQQQLAQASAAKDVGSIPLDEGHAGSRLAQLLGV